MTQADVRLAAPPGVERTNPFVGPRSLGPTDPIYGRSREIHDLASMLVAERIVLLYSPSGAGKSSLLEAGLRPELQRRDFSVFPTIRVGFEPDDADGAETRNRYVHSVLASLEEGRVQPARMNPDDMSRISLEDYLDRLVADDPGGGDACFIFDQFEEVFTLDPSDYDAKAAFISELGVVLRNRGRWAIFAMREDLIAQLDPYVAHIPGRLAVRFRLDLLAPPAALVAVRRTAADAGVDFAEDAAGPLIDDLRRVRVQRGGQTSEELGPSVEPVQLQVVCRQLWTTLPADARSIRAEHVAALGSVDNALGDFYADSVGAVAERTRAGEREIRTWFDEELITESGFRTQVPEGPGPYGPAVLRELENAHLIRSERRRGTEWYELAHDRLIEPIRTNNGSWRERMLGPLQRDAREWEQRGRPPGLLLLGPRLAEAERWTEENPGASLPIDTDFLNASRAEQRRVDLERRAVRWKLTAAIATSVLTLAALAGVGFALRQSIRGEREAQEALELVVACVEGDDDVCDDLYERTGDEEVAGTCGFRSDVPRGGRCGEEALALQERCEGGTMESCEELFFFAGGDSDDLAIFREPCQSGDMAACDLLYSYSEEGSNDAEFAATCGGLNDEGLGGACELSGGRGFRELRDRCQSGDMAACDGLYFNAEEGSDDAEFGATCGGRSTESTELLGGSCAETGGDGFPELRARCESGDMAACDLLYTYSEVGSVDEEFGATCGGRSTDEDIVGSCEETFGSSVP